MPVRLPKRALRARRKAGRYPPDEEARALALFDEGRTDQGIAAMQVLADRFPGEAPLHLWLSSMTVTVGRFDDAAAHADRALAAAPDDPIVLFRAASVLRWSDTARARALLEASERGLAPDSLLADVLRPDFDHLNGLIAHDEGRLEVAVGHFERAFRAEPDGLGHGADLAVAYLEAGRHRDALDVIARALEHYPGGERLLELQRQAEADDDD